MKKQPDEENIYKGDPVFGEHLRKLIKKKYETQKGFAIKVGCSEVYLCNVLQGKTGACQSMLKRFHDALEEYGKEIFEYDAPVDDQDVNTASSSITGSWK